MHSIFDQFDNSMVIHLWNGGGMNSSSQDVYISFDSCICVEILQRVDNVTQFDSKPENRTKV